jgi:PTH1 family peptidyl-tRNA hydrolase
MQDACLVVGLGNPGDKYRETRHNAGFLAIDRFCQHFRCELKAEPKFDARIARTSMGGRQLILCQPQTYMNASGQSVSKIVGFYKVEIGNLIVVVDDADLDLGTIRLRQRGSSGGHNGLKSIASVLGGDDYARLKIGIGRHDSGVLHDHVLGRFETGEMNLLERVLDKVIDQVQVAFSDGLEVAMSRFNGRLTTEERE